MDPGVGSSRHRQAGGFPKECRQGLFNHARHRANAGLPGLGGLHPYLLSTQFDAWQGFLRTPVDWAPIVRAVWVCALYAVPALVGAALVFLRRDVAGS